MSGWMYAFGQNLLLLAFVAALGVVVGLLIARARTVKTGAAAISEHSSESSEAAETPESPESGEDTEAGAEVTAVTAARDAGEAKDPADGRDERITSLQRQLDAARERVEWLSAQMEEVEGHAAVEYGRLEAAALRALDETISADQQRIESLQEELAKAQAEQLDHHQHLLVSEQRFESMRSALADRDARIAELDNELKELRRHGAKQKVKEGPR